MTLQHSTVAKMNAPGKIPNHGSLLIVVIAIPIVFRLIRRRA